MLTYGQKMAQIAFQRVREASNRNSKQEYGSFALSFPSLLHSCGLAQAISFAEAKGKSDYLNDLSAVLNAAENGEEVNLSERSRNAEIVEYMRLSRRAVSAASWLKRYVQALIED